MHVQWKHHPHLPPILLRSMVESGVLIGWLIAALAVGIILFLGELNMGPLSRILVPVVFSDNCRGALRYAVTLASPFGAELTILHVLEPLVCFETESNQALEYIDKCRRDWAMRQMKTLAFTMGARRRLAIRTAIIDGDPAREIVAFARNDASDLIVMATHGHGQFRRFLMGSVTAKVLHDTACPVWTGSHLEQGLQPEEIDIPHLLCALDPDQDAGEQLRWASSIRSAFDSRVTVLHILRAGEDRQTVHRDLEQRCEAAGLTAEVLVEAGTLPAAVCDAASRLAASLLIIGREQEPRTFRDSSYAVLHHCGSPVLSIAGSTSRGREAIDHAEVQRV